MKKCSHCNGSLKDDYDFCPFCGNNSKSAFDKEDYGFLGKNDFAPTGLPFGEPFVDKLFSNAMRLFERQMKSLQKELIRDAHIQKKMPRNQLNVQCYVNGKRGFPDKKEPEEKIAVPAHSAQEKFVHSAHLPRKEASAKLRRYSDKLVYELTVPGVKSVEDVLVNQLENSVEIKALSDEAVYTKQLQVNLPVIKYTLKKDVLIVELGNR